jgi:hypothetical protein
MTRKGEGVVRMRAARLFLIFFVFIFIFIPAVQLAGVVFG